MSAWAKARAVDPSAGDLDQNKTKQKKKSTIKYLDEKLRCVNPLLDRGVIETHPGYVQSCGPVGRLPPGSKSALDTTCPYERVCNGIIRPVSVAWVPPPLQTDGHGRVQWDPAALSIPSIGAWSIRLTYRFELGCSLEPPPNRAVLFGNRAARSLDGVKSPVHSGSSADLGAACLRAPPRATLNEAPHAIGQRQGGDSGSP